MTKLFLEQKSVLFPNRKNVNNLLNTSDELIRGLKPIGGEATNRGSWLIYLLLQTFAPESWRIWPIESTEKEFSTLKEFFSFLKGNSLILKTIRNIPKFKLSLVKAQY